MFCFWTMFLNLALYFYAKMCHQITCALQSKHVRDRWVVRDHSWMHASLAGPERRRPAQLAAIVLFYFNLNFDRTFNGQIFKNRCHCANKTLEVLLNCKKWTSEHSILDYLKFWFFYRKTFYYSNCSLWIIYKSILFCLDTQIK